MTREKVKEIAGILLAFADGKAIQKKCYHGWQDLPTLTSEHIKDALLEIKGEYMEYRVKPELKLVPFTFDDNKEFRDRWLKSKYGSISTLARVIAITETYISIEASNRIFHVDYSTLMSTFTFEDGSPCGKFIEI